MLHTIQKAVQFANPYVIDALTKCHGVYVNVYDKEEADAYDEGRDAYISNHQKYKSKPTYEKIQLLLNDPVQEVYDSNENTFDNYLNDIYFLVAQKTFLKKKMYSFEKEQKFEIFYDKNSDKPNRVLQCFEIHEVSNSYNQWSVRKIMLQPFN